VRKSSRRLCYGLCFGFASCFGVCLVEVVVVGGFFQHGCGTEPVGCGSFYVACGCQK